MSLKSFLALAVLLASGAAQADPLLYHCKLIDYLETGAVLTEFQYWQVGESRTFESEQSLARLYLNEEGQLSTSLRLRADPTAYSAAVGYDNPRRLSLTHLGQARLDCEL
jgi:hypothetical protein